MGKTRFEISIKDGKTEALVDGTGKDVITELSFLFLKNETLRELVKSAINISERVEKFKI